MVILTVAELSRDDLREDDPLRHDLQEILDAGPRAASPTRQLLAFKMLFRAPTLCNSLGHARPRAGRSVVTARKSWWSRMRRACAR